MYSANFSYHSPKSVSEAAKLLKEFGPDAKILSGGMSLIPLMKMRVVPIRHIIDIGKISDLKGIEDHGNTIKIGGATRHHDLEMSDAIRRKVPLMSETASWIGDPQVRNRGTIGGALSHADPSGDWGSCLLALRGKVIVSNGASEREIGADDLFVDIFETSIKETEILTSITVPSYEGKGQGFSYLKMERKAGDFATVGAAVQITLDPTGVCKYVGIGLTSLGPKPLRAKKGEEVLKGKKVTHELIAEASAASADDSNPNDDPLRASAEFKKYLCGVYTKRALETALERAGGGQ